VRPTPIPPRRTGSKRGLEQAVTAVRTAHPDATVTVWAEDEHRLGLLPIRRRIWAPRGQRPTVPSDRRYQWLYVYGIVRPTTGETWWCLLPSMRTEAMTVALAEFARDEGIDAAHRVVIVWDGAGSHTSADLVVPEGIDLVPLPPYSPELQPAERLWPLVDEAIANRTFAKLDALEAVLVNRCRTLRAQQATIRDLTCYHWWPDEPSPATSA
jgi:transposase